MSEGDALNLAKAHAAAWEVPWRQVLETLKEKNGGVWWFGKVVWYTFVIDTGDGKAIVSNHSESGSVTRFEYCPSDPKGLLLPLWAAYPTYTSVSAGWRQAYGEQYRYKWHTFFQELAENVRADYRRKFPVPADEERGWQGFYELMRQMR